MVNQCLKKVAALSICLVAIYLLFSGGISVAKAHLAQYLLERAWQASRYNEPIKPWPGADTFPVAKLSIKKLNYSAVVLHGVTGESLAFGPGHLTHSASPGQRGNSVIAGHRDSHFRSLEHLEVGDLIGIEPLGAKKIEYQVYKLQIVDKSDVSVLEDTDSAELTLITCYPFDAISAGGPLRYVASAAVVDGPTDSNE